MSREQTVGLAGGLAGLALVAGVVVWRLAIASYRADVETMCHAEARSGLVLSKDMQALTAWLRGHLTTPEGNELLSRLGDAPMSARAARLRDAAASVGAGACPMTASYESLVNDGDYRADLQRLCSYVTFPDLAAGDDAARLAALEDWIEGQAKNPRTQALAAPLRSAGTPAERARVLREASGEMGIYTCDVAKTLETPPPPLDAGD
jgi:hypothetical protein